MSARGHGDPNGGGEDRGLLERAGDEIRGWFGDDDGERRGGRGFERGRSRPWDSESGRERARGDWTGEDRSSFGGMAQGGAPGRGDWQRERERERERERDRGERSEALGYGEFGGTLGGFGNQRFATSQDELYRRWRDRQMEQLDREYEDYCRDCEQQFDQDFDSWRRSRRGRSDSDEPILGGGQAPAAAAPEAAGAGETTDGAPGEGGPGSPERG